MDDTIGGSGRTLEQLSAYFDAGRSPRVAAIEVWKKPGRPAVHPTEAEYATVLEGAGTLVSGGTLVTPVTRPNGMIEGERIAHRTDYWDSLVFQRQAGVA